MSEVLTAIGLMSGTSLDGVDAALIRTDGEQVAAFGPSLTLPYPEEVRDRLRGVLGRRADEPGVAEAAAELTDWHASAVLMLIEENKLSIDNIDIIGFHGQTILHRPAERLTVQIGDGAALARRLGRPVVNDFRTADMRAGGQGAPLVPLFHAALVGRDALPAAVVNIGGVANITYVGADGTVIACDTGPGNAPIDDWMRRHGGAARDEGGALAARGRVDEDRLAGWMAHPFFRRPPPKSLDRDDFTAAGAGGLSPADGAATLTEFTARSILRIAEHLPDRPRRWIVCGGGRHNAHLMARLAALADGTVLSADALGWDGDAIEAQAFGFLAVRSLKGLPLSLPGTTGVPVPMPGGRLHRPPV